MHYQAHAPGLFWDGTNTRATQIFTRGGGALNGPAIRPAVQSLVRKAEIAAACSSAEARLGTINADLGPV